MDMLYEQETMVGYYAYLDGYMRHENPYQRNSLEHHNWAFGWDVGEDSHSKAKPQTPEVSGDCGC